MGIDTSGRGWSLTDHVCRICMGRIVERNALFMCSSCEVTASLRPHAICGCGMKSMSAKAIPGALHGAYRCGINPNRGHLSPGRLAILFGGEPVNSE